MTRMLLLGLGATATLIGAWNVFVGFPLTIGAVVILRRLAYANARR